jgi:hypothetical protein
MRKQIIPFGSLALLPAALLAQFGFSVVSDPTQEAHSWSQLMNDIQKIKLATNTYQQITAAYNLAMAAAQYIPGTRKYTFETLAQMAMQDYTRDMQGENKQWSAVLNGNASQAGGAWQEATVGLNAGLSMPDETPGHSQILARLASIEAVDGASTGCLQTVGQYHSNSITNALGPILKLAIARIDGTANTNSQVEQLNLLNAHQGQANNELLAQGQINSCIAQQLTLTNKIQRDNMAETMNFSDDVTFAQNTQPTAWGNSAQTISNW